MSNKIKNTILIQVVAVLFLVISATSGFASNVGRDIYGVFSETYNGAHYLDYDEQRDEYDNGSNDEDAIAYFWAWGGVSAVPGTTNAPEGSEYVRFSLNSNYTWGGGGSPAKNAPLTNDVGYKNMSDYYTGKIKFLVKSSNAKAANFKVGIKANDKEFLIPLSSLGFNTNSLSTWQELSLKISDLTDKDNNSITASDLQRTQYLFYFDRGGNYYGFFVDFDNIRWLKASAKSTLSITLKNVNDNSKAANQTRITWDEESSFRNGWVVAQQYFEFDDMDIDYTDANFINKNWYITLTTNNGGADKNGLVCSESGLDKENSVLPICWRMVFRPIPYYIDDGKTIDAATLSIGENIPAKGDRNLYDSGVPTPAPGYVTWFYMKDSASNDTSDYVKIMKFNNDPEKRGIHGQLNSGTGEYPFWNFVQYKIEDCRPRLYIGANFDKALGGSGMVYNTTIAITLNYE